MLYLLRDDFFGDKRLAELRARVGPPDVQSLNVANLDGARLTVGELRASVEAFPFLSDRRVVVVRKLFGASPSRGESDPDSTETRRGRAEGEREFLAYLPKVPPFTDLVLIVDREFRANHAAVKAVRDTGGEVLLGEVPEGDEMVRWIGDQVHAKGGTIEAPALTDLASLSVDDLRELDHILETLVTYVGPRAITTQDVRAIVRRGRESTVFALVDAVGARDRRGALESLRILLDGGEAPIYLLVMLARQIRLLLLANEAMSRNQDVAGALKTPPWVARKVVQQARAFDVKRCVDAYAKIVAADAAIKTGQSEEEIAVELLVLELTDR